MPLNEAIIAVLGAFTGFDSTECTPEDLLLKVFQAIAGETGHEASIPSKIQDGIRQMPALRLTNQGWAFSNDVVASALQDFQLHRGKDEDEFLRNQAIRLPCFARSYGIDSICQDCPGKNLCHASWWVRKALIGEILDRKDTHRREETRKAVAAALHQEKQDAEREQARSIETIKSILDMAPASGAIMPATDPFETIASTPEGVYCSICKQKIRIGSRSRFRVGVGSYHIECEGR